MKNYIYVLGVLWTATCYLSCTKCNNECFNFWNGERITFIDENNSNYLDPIKGIEIEYFKTKSGINIEYVLKDYSIDINSPEEIWHIETISNVLIADCLEQNCDLYIKFSSRTLQDTIGMSINKITENCCTSHVTNGFSFNNELVEDKEKTIGGFRITVR